MAELYRKVVDDEGNEELVQVDLNAVELPDDTFYNDPRYKEVADRDYNRRQQVKELQEKLEAQEVNSTEEESDETTVDSGLTPEEFERMWQQREQDFEARMLQRITDRQREQVEKSERISNIIKENNLPSDVRSVLESVDDPESVATTLARAGMKLGSNKDGGEQGTSLDETLAKINKRLNLGD